MTTIDHEHQQIIEQAREKFRQEIIAWCHSLGEALIEAGLLFRQDQSGCAEGSRFALVDREMVQCPIYIGGAAI